MTDKELFEKVEKEFYPEKSLRLERFNKTNFQKVLNEVKGPQAPQANVGGFLSRVAAAIPGTRGYRMRSAEARKQEAIARQEEIKAQQAEKDLKFGKKHKIGNAIARKYYDANPLYATAYDLVQAGKPITPDQRRAYNAGNKEIKALQQGEEKQKGKDEAFTKLGEDLFKKFDVEAPLVDSFLRKPENENIKILFQKYILQETPISETELNQLAGGLISLYFDKQNRPRNKESATKLINFLKKQ